MDSKDKIIASLKEENDYLKELLAKHNILFSMPKKFDDVILSKEEKIRLYRDYFDFRENPIRKVYHINGEYIYSIICLNRYNKNLCPKARGEKANCSLCLNLSSRQLDEKLIIAHMKGELSLAGHLNHEGDLVKVIVLHLDKSNSLEIAIKFQNIAKRYDIEVAFVKGLKDNDLDLYIFFEDFIKTKQARQIVTFLINKMFSLAETDFDISLYDAIIPECDYESKKISKPVIFPLGKEFNKNTETLLVDANLVPYKNQFGYLKSIKKVGKSTLNYLTSLLVEEDVKFKGSAFKNFNLKKEDFKDGVSITIDSMINIDTRYISLRALNVFKRIATTINSKFYENERRRLGSFNEPRFISLYEDINPLSLKLPLGTLDDVLRVFKLVGLNVPIKNLRNEGQKIDVKFIGTLREEQVKAFNELIQYTNGILEAPTAFGKTILAIYLIAYFKVNTLILVDKESLLTQWVAKINEFLEVNYEFKQEKDKIGRYNSTKKKLTSKIDVASIKSFGNDDVSSTILSNYGLVIIDEVHHLGAPSLAKISKKINSKYLYGLTATPKRSDGNMDIVFKLLGPIRYVSKLNFDSFIKCVTPIYTDFHYEKKTVYNDHNEAMNLLTKDEARNKLVTSEIIKRMEEKRFILVLSSRIEQLDYLLESLEDTNYKKFKLTGSLKLSEKKQILKEIKETVEPFAIFSTGQYIGEGFDEPRLDTLFLVTPFKWDGLQKQYLGRIERTFINKTSIEVIDFCDTKCQMFLNMFSIRTRGYNKEGYIFNDGNNKERNFLLTNFNYKGSFYLDLNNAKKITLYSLNFDKEYVCNIFKNRNIKVTLITKEEVNDKIDGIDVIKHNPNIKTNLVFIDESIVYYGSINLLIPYNTASTILRINDPSLVKDMKKDIDK